LNLFRNINSNTYIYSYRLRV